MHTKPMRQSQSMHRDPIAWVCGHLKSVKKDKHTLRVDQRMVHPFFFLQATSLAAATAIHTFPTRSIKR